MKKGFKIPIEELKELDILDYSSNYSSKKTINFFNDLKTFLNSDGTLNGDLIVNTNFPCKNSYDFFISHSHNDIEIIKPFVSFLESIGFTVFLDSYIWQSADKLLKEIDRCYCYKEDTNTYDYNKRNFSTTHVHLMLSSALGEVIKNSSYFILIESPQSIKLNNSFDTLTSSPWIFQELQYFNLLTKHCNYYALENLDENAVLNITRKADTSNLQKLTAEILKRWEINPKDI